MPEIKVNDPADVTIDGRPSGTLVDVLANHARDPADPAHAEFRAALHAAHLDWHGSLVAKHEAAIKEHGQVVTKIHADHAAALQEQTDRHAKAVAALQAQVKDQQVLIDTLGGTELGQKMARDARRETARQAAAKAQADLDAIDAEGGKATHG